MSITRCTSLQTWLDEQRDESFVPDFRIIRGKSRRCLCIPASVLIRILLQDSKLYRACLDTNKNRRLPRSDGCLPWLLHDKLRIESLNDARPPIENEHLSLSSSCSFRSTQPARTIFDDLGFLNDQHDASAQDSFSPWHGLGLGRWPFVLLCALALASCSACDENVATFVRKLPGARQDIAFAKYLNALVLCMVSETIPCQNFCAETRAEQITGFCPPSYTRCEASRMKRRRLSINVSKNNSRSTAAELDLA